ncbi:1, 4-alpha-D-glucan glucohydrolase [Lophiotrema nucula]|uniref:Glucoamylase n=1 Tax=Lophiotrema nucula TaxID=690887 RepID=A0A6A5YHU0_9PLEO|nr:1, 4-alpha-D-glucan glucohydrolase [Lophiotrema nucula]
MILRPLAAAVAALSVCGADGRSFLRRDLASRVETETEIAFQGVLDNLGPDGSKAPGAEPGIIVASPSTEDPNYFYTWTRDASLTFKMIVDEFLHGKSELQPIIQDYLKAQAILQTVSNPSGALSSGRGLGEPKFYVNETRFNGNWGRPQRDGPALRATALITYGNWLLDSGDEDEARDQVWPVVQNDLNYVAQYWNDTTFDLWEEVLGSSFFTTAAQHRSLIEGIAFGQALDQDVSAYESQAPNILCHLQTYWNGEYVVANVGIQQQRSGVDANTVLASIATFDPEATCDDALFQPCSARALANLKVYVDSFRETYTLNRNANGTAAATGRYAEDVYYGGNPWYLTTLAVAEQIYDAIQTWSSLNSLTITDLDLPFWQDFYPSAAVGTYTPGDDGTSTFTKLVDAALAYADAFVSIALKYTPASGALAEQYSRENGTAVSARDLTWSYASFVTMRAARLSATTDYPQVPSWGAPSGDEVPEGACVASSVIGTYSPATGAGAPPGSGGCTVLVTFNVNASTFFGENIYLSGSSVDLGEWRTGDALAMSASGYTDARPLWSAEVELPANSSVVYHYLRNEPDGSWLYETTNRTLDVPVCGNMVGGSNATVEDAWVGPVGTPPSKLV